MPWEVGMWPTQIPLHNIVIQCHPHYHHQQEVVESVTLGLSRDKCELDLN